MQFTSERFGPELCKGGKGSLFFTLGEFVDWVMHDAHVDLAAELKSELGSGAVEEYGAALAHDMSEFVFAQRNDGDGRQSRARVYSEGIVQGDAVAAEYEMNSARAANGDDDDAMEDPRGEPPEEEDEAEEALEPHHRQV